MSKASIDKLRRKLVDEKTHLEEARARHHEHEGMNAELGDIGDYDINHPADSGSAMFEREKDAALSENIASMLAQVNEALAKLEAGTYGSCNRCGQPIAEARLATLPYAAFCITCQNRVEGE